MRKSVRVEVAVVSRLGVVTVSGNIGRDEYLRPGRGIQAAVSGSVVGAKG